MKTEIPQGQTREEIKQREKVIKNFYAQWNASLRYSSTKAITFLTEILELATVKSKTKPKPEVSNQRRFEEIILMEYCKTELGKIKLTVGLLRGSKQYIQYCITAIEEETATS